MAACAALLGCAPPRATQFVGQDGSRDWWTVECGSDEAACWTQAKAACHDNFEVREVRAGRSAPQPLVASVRDGVVPSLPASVEIREKALTILCASPTLPPPFVAGPECGTSPPRPNHCEDAAGLTFRTGRTYLLPVPPGSSSVATDATEPLAPDAALAELRALTDGLDLEMDAIGKPIAAVDGIVTEVRDFPRTYRVNASQWRALVKAELGHGRVTLPSNLRQEVKDDMAALLVKLRAADAALSATPAKAEALLEKIAVRHARVHALGVAASAHWVQVQKDPNATAAERADADAGLADIAQLQVDTRTRLDAHRTNLTALSSQILQALTRLGDAAS